MNSPLLLPQELFDEAWGEMHPNTPEMYNLFLNCLRRRVPKLHCSYPKLNEEQEDAPSSASTSYFIGTPNISVLNTAKNSVPFEDNSLLLGYGYRSTPALHESASPERSQDALRAVAFDPNDIEPWLREFGASKGWSQQDIDYMCSMDNNATQSTSTSSYEQEDLTNAFDTPLVNVAGGTSVAHQFSTQTLPSYNEEADVDEEHPQQEYQHHTTSNAFYGMQSQTPPAMEYHSEIVAMGNAYTPLAHMHQGTRPVDYIKERNIFRRGIAGAEEQLRLVQGQYINEVAPTLYATPIMNGMQADFTFRVDRHGYDMHNVYNAVASTSQTTHVHAHRSNHCHQLDVVAAPAQYVWSTGLPTLEDDAALQPNTSIVNQAVPLAASTSSSSKPRYIATENNNGSQEREPSFTCAWGACTETLVHWHNEGETVDAYRNRIEAHIKAHTNAVKADHDRKYACEWAGCMASIGESRGLFRHVAREKHANLKVRCPHCRKDFSRDDTLSRHIKDACQNHAGQAATPGSENRPAKKRRLRK
ncbi:Krueppel-like factor 15 [Hypsizygus marmoreus]|uniref:Krueppel-like factor 15 n=1 Tax=Hypsizygus marmoreus TaxID=39966 RepID=A0A369K6D5_HYPMA|nr:Krueppel-like factor 15 [Hypsizygus marmoreus]